MSVTDIAYRELLSEQLPRAIHSDREHRRYLTRVEQLLELLSILREHYEDGYQPIGATDPISALKELMRAKGLSQAELSKLLGSSGIASEVLAGKRALSKSHIRKLSEHFHVSAEVFV